MSLHHHSTCCYVRVSLALPGDSARLERVFYQTLEP